MAKKFKKKLIGKRIVLKYNPPLISTATAIFKVIDANRKHLAPWFPWEKTTKKVEDSFIYLLGVEKEFKNGKKVDYGIYLNNEYIGNIGIFDIDPEKRSAEIGYWLCSKFTRQGYVSEAVKLIEKEFFLNHNLNRIQIKCDEINKASAGVAMKCGYKLEGKIREDAYEKSRKKFRNTLLFSKLKSEYK